MNNAEILSPEALLHYSNVDEESRLTKGAGQLELLRSLEIIRRYLPKPPAKIIDIGGGCGIYACLLAKQGYTVTLIDAVPLHIEKAKKASQLQPDLPIKEIALGDACNLPYQADTFDAALLLGPLYHLTKRNDRLQAIREVRRVLKNDCYLFAAVISRFASMLDGYFRKLILDPVFQEIMINDLKDGQHRNPTNHPAYFTTTYFHHPSELKTEIEEAGLKHEVTNAIEGMAWLLPNFEEYWQDQEQREVLLNTIRTIESEDTIIGISAHIMAVGRKE
ncbi:MAG: class I SAM-dependent methyltransferase [Acidobacteriota bacterium]